MICPILIVLIYLNLVTIAISCHFIQTTVILYHIIWRMSIPIHVLYMNYSHDSQDTLQYSELKGLSLNVGGLRCRMKNPEFHETVCDYDIVCLQETRFCKFDSLDWIGYKCLPLMTRSNVRYRSGGIAILVKDHLFDYIKITKNDGDHLYWFTIEDQFPFKILFCVVYIAPEGSNYSNIECFDSLENDIVNFSSNGYKICLLGDFNAHTKNADDYICVDSTIQQTLDLNNIDENLSFCSIEQLGFLKERFNSDLSRMNNYGKRLLELRRSCDLNIANGRLGRDRFLGRKTCKGVSVVDYVILSPILFPYISNFEILPFDPMLSDAYSGIAFSLNCNEMDLNPTIHQNNCIPIARATWVKTEAFNFIKRLNVEKIDSFINR